MAQQITNIRNIKVGDIVKLTYDDNQTIDLIVTKVENNSWYYNDFNCRNSFDTLEGFFNNSGHIVKCEIIKA